MKEWTVNSLAALAGITVRALHHYDEIGLLKPARVGENRYRYYGEEELLRLQQILLHRRLGIPLSEIGALLDAPGFDRLPALKEQRRRLDAEAKRYRQLVRTIDRTIAALEGDRAMKHEDLYRGIVPSEKQAEYEDWLIDRFGAPMREEIDASRAKAAGAGPEGMQESMRALAEIEGALVGAMREGVVPEARALDALIERHRAWVADAWTKPCTPQAYAGLADLYEGHADFVARFETLGKGFARWLPAAMRAWARRQTA
ncbi:MerR family transcriptional regulator [Nitratireductor pacificus]|uniref:Transcriptional regulator, MerR family protein n=1 Tax=Nitratireductor pacificus pht-3B TaxID=391937 RepID=K2MJS0_9HYPH|nr:MerR family transcriptional regulator [Nitratireductor pacificus]EKF17432.1 transcriptional regulator, MerR family protein [Nitratireductor pacificus pht-3B]